MVLRVRPAPVDSALLHSLPCVGCSWDVDVIIGVIDADDDDDEDDDDGVKDVDDHSMIPS